MSGQRNSRRHTGRTQTPSWSLDSSQGWRVNITELPPWTPGLGRFLQGASREEEEEVPSSCVTTSAPPALWVWEPAPPGSQASLPLSDPTRHIQPFPSGPAGRPWPVSGLSLGARPVPGARPGPTQRSALPPVTPSGRELTGQPRTRARVELPVVSLAGACEGPPGKTYIALKGLRIGLSCLRLSSRKGAPFSGFPSPFSLSHTPGLNPS